MCLQLQRRGFESHPEISFWALNAWPMQPNIDDPESLFTPNCVSGEIPVLPFLHSTNWE
jgi:predicted RNase H-like nuclease